MNIMETSKKMQENPNSIKQSDNSEARLICGIIMPISSIDGCGESHWEDVMSIIKECIDNANFDPNLVSNADDIGIIQKRIIQNLYENPIVVCDVSGKNPNVMFELGIRLAFDKPTIIIKDDKTSYSFDTSPIEHLDYPRDLRYNKIEEFKTKLTDKIIKTYEKSCLDNHYSTFLKHFGEFKVAKLDTKIVSKEDYILDELKNLQASIYRLSKVGVSSDDSPRTTSIICIRPKEGCKADDLNIEKINSITERYLGYSNVKITELNHAHILVDEKHAPINFILKKIENAINLENYEVRIVRM